MVFDPPVGFQWPMQVGKTWTSKHTVTTPATGKERSAGSELEGGGLGGRHGAGGHLQGLHKVVTTNNFGEVETRWTAPAAGIVLAKRLVTRPASHPQGAGELEAGVAVSGAACQMRMGTLGCPMLWVAER
jgi:hypothetical protein